MKEQDRGNRKIAHSADTGNSLDTVFQAEEVQSGIRIIDLEDESFDPSVDVLKSARVLVPEDDLEQTSHSIRLSDLAKQSAENPVSFSLEQLEETINAKAPSLPSEATITGAEQTLAQPLPDQQIIKFKDHLLPPKEKLKKRSRIEVKEKVEKNPDTPKIEHIVTLSEKPRVSLDFTDPSGNKLTADCVPFIHVQDLKAIIPQGPMGISTVDGKVSVDVVLEFGNGERASFQQFPFDIVGPVSPLEESKEGAA